MTQFISQSNNHDAPQITRPRGNDRAAAFVALRVLIFASIFAAIYVAPCSLRCAHAEFVIDDFTQGTPVDVTYTEGHGYAISQTGLDAQHVLGGARIAFFDAVSGPPNSTARAALDTTAGTLALDSIQGQNLGGGGLEIRYGNYSDAEPNLNFDLTQFAGERLEIEIQYLVAGDSKGINTAISWNTNLHSIDPQLSNGQIELINNFTNVTRTIPNTATPMTVSLPIADLLGGSANAADLAGVAFRFDPLGGGGGLVIGKISIVPEPSAYLLAALAMLSLLGRRWWQKSR